VNVEAAGKVGIAPMMVPALLVSLIAFSVVYLFLVRSRTALQARMDAIEGRKASLQ
jgi:hypothetical protein